MRLLGYVWSAIPHAVIALALLITVYFPRKIWWDGYQLHVVVRWRLIPPGTGAQTHWIITFWDSLERSQKLTSRRHERKHVNQGMRWGPIYFFSYQIELLARLLMLIGGDLLNYLMKRGWEAYRQVSWEKQAEKAENEID